MALAASATVDGVTVTIAPRRVERAVYEWDAHVEVSAMQATANPGGLRGAMVAGFTAALDKMIAQNEEIRKR